MHLRDAVLLVVWARAARVLGGPRPRVGRVPRREEDARDAGVTVLAPVAVPAAGALVLGLGVAVVGVAAAVATVAGPVFVIRSKLKKAKRRG